MLSGWRWHWKAVRLGFISISLFPDLELLRRQMEEIRELAQEDDS